MTLTPSPTTQDAVPRTSVKELLGITADVVVPLLARGVIARRPKVLGAVDRLDADRRSVRRMQQIRERYGPGPVVLRMPLRTMALILSAEHVHRVLDGTPEPFATASLEKRAALSHFQPHGVLISDPQERAVRRPFNAAVLDEDRPVHRMAEALVAKVHEEAEALAEDVRRSGSLTWDSFIVAWWRMVRRVVLGDAARDDHALTDMLTQLRHDANWAFLKPKRTKLRQRFLRQLRGHLDRAEPGSLAERIAALQTTDRTAPSHQVPQWLFAFDPAGMSSFRTLALLATHPAQARRVRDEIAERDLSAPQRLPYLRACVLESLRLWPTSPAVLRDTTTETTWETGTLPAGAGVFIFSPLFHRDDRTLPWSLSPFHLSFTAVPS
jgi:hypothetical protein